jgi:hypothetical protein
MATLLVGGVGVGASSALGQTKLADRAVVSFSAPEMGGVLAPRFIYERELAVEARFEALSDERFQASDEQPYLERHVSAALERHIAEALLENLEILPEPSSAELRQRSISARLLLAQRIGGDQMLARAALAEGISDGELWRLFQRQARASLYLDRMVTPMLDPSVAELKNLHRGGQTPFSGRAFEQVETALRRWYVARRLNAALSAFYESARSRVRIQSLARDSLSQTAREPN